jgi:hypothetical protein
MERRTSAVVGRGNRTEPGGGLYPVLNGVHPWSTERLGRITDAFTMPNLNGAACAGDVAFTERPLTEQAATCSACPVQLSCLNAAQAFGERWHVWGGREPAERARSGVRVRGGRAEGVRRYGLATKICEHCGKTFKGANRAKWCSRACARSEQCGKPIGARAHKAAGEPLCAKCRNQQATRQRSRREKERSRSGVDQDVAA